MINNNPATQTLIEHLIDLRKCIVSTLWIIAIGFGISVYFSEHIFDFIRHPIAPYLGDGGGLVFTAPIDKFMAHMKVSFLTGVIVTCPLWLYQVWLFIAPALYRKERKMAIYFLLFGSVLFLIGVTFVYKLVYPMAFKYLLSFGGNIDKPMITINEYMDFFVSTTLLFGLAFEMPLIILLLSIIGIIDEEFLKTKRRIAIMLMAVISAIITPPDALSMLAMLAPLLLLYELSIVLVKYIKKNAEKTIT
ncbi:MAG: twin-arginine translocase subunit TatC [Bdellovibrionales bacterium]